MIKIVEYAKQIIAAYVPYNLAKQALDEMEKRLCGDCCCVLCTYISEEDKKSAASMLQSYWASSKAFIPTIEMMNIKQYLDIPHYFHPAVKYEKPQNIPDVSIVIPVYNTAAYVGKCLDSILSQKIDDINLEIICVNDGSIDNSLKILEYYRTKDDRISIISQKNAGLSAARNAGMRMARGKYLYFIDSDDWLVRDAIQILYSLAEEKQLDIVCFGAQSYYENDDLQKMYANAFDNRYNRKPTIKQILNGKEMMEYYNDNCNFISSVQLQFYRKSFLDNNGFSFFEGIYHEDVLFSALVLPKAERVCVYPENLYCRLIRAESIMTQKITKRHFEGKFIVFARINSEAIICRKEDEEQRRFLSQTALKMLSMAKADYKMLSQEDKNVLMQQYGEEYRILYDSIFNYSPIDEELHQKYITDINNLKNSFSFRIGRFITFVPRKIRGGIKCFEENGARYTFHRILQHLRILK